MSNLETMLSGDRTPPSEAELIDALENVQTTGGPKAGFRRLEVLEWLHDTLPALLADRARVEATQRELAATQIENSNLLWGVVNLRSALECWGHHHDWCASRGSTSETVVACNCGYADAVQGATRAPGASGSGT